jgi:hypothetical protein
MDRYTPYLIVSAAIALIVGLLVLAFWLYSKWKVSAQKAYEESGAVDRLGIGGLLWFPAIWTVTDFFTGVIVANQAPAIGWALILLAIPNAVLFWSRNWAYTHFFFIKSILGLSVLIGIYGAQAIGYGVAFAILAIGYLYFSKRSKRTFIHRLNGSVRNAI